jgi:hypothetical protein
MITFQKIYAAVICCLLTLLGARAEASEPSFISCQKAIKTSSFLPLLTRLDGLTSPFYVDEFGVNELVSPYKSTHRRKGTLNDISDEARDRLTFYDECMVLSPLDFLVIGTRNGTNFNGLYHFDLRKQADEDLPWLLRGYLSIKRQFKFGTDSKAIILSSKDPRDESQGFDVVQLSPGNKGNPFFAYSLDGNFGGIDDKVSLENVDLKNRDEPVLRFTIQNECGKKFVYFRLNKDRRFESIEGQLNGANIAKASCKQSKPAGGSN